MSEDFIRKYIHVVKGHCFGIGISLRGKNDPHVMFTLLYEDDEHWWDEVKGDTVTFSNFWHYDIPQCIKEAEEWCKNNCEIDEKEGRNWGWKYIK